MIYLNHPGGGDLAVIVIRSFHHASRKALPIRSGMMCPIATQLACPFGGRGRHSSLMILSKTHPLQLLLLRKSGRNQRPRKPQELKDLHLSMNLFMTKGNVWLSQLLLSNMI